MSPLLSLLISILIIILLIVKVKINAAISLFVGAMFMGISAGLAPVSTIQSITGGFGNTLANLGLSVGFGIMLGQLIAATGAVQVIANKILKAAGEKRADYAIGVTGLVVSTPVFFDVTIVLLAPIARSLARASKKHICYFSGALVLGAGYAHTFIPPTPGPMTAAELAGVDLGIMILYGTLVGLPTFLISTLIYFNLFLRRKGFLKDSDLEIKDGADQSGKSEFPENPPPFFLSILPILIPITMILTGTFYKASVGGANVPQIIGFIGDKSVALFAGFLTAFLISLKSLDLGKIAKELNESFPAIGMVLFITGLGGALGSVIQASGVGNALIALFEAINIPIILAAWIVASLMKIAQGSGTIAMITSITIVAPLIPVAGAAPVWVALAACSGSLMGGHVNDSGFWVATKLSGMSTIGGVKIYTLTCAIQSIISIIIILLLSTFL